MFQRTTRQKLVRPKVVWGILDNATLDLTLFAFSLPLVTLHCLPLVYLW